MRDWLKNADEIDRDCIHQWEKLLGISFHSYTEYERVDSLISEMVLEYETKKELLLAYPKIEEDAERILYERDTEGILYER